MKRQKGFTLIELSIVLVIIGLIVGGVLVGQDLIKAAQLRSLMLDTQKYQTAIYTFKSKYGCLPGDCIDATMFWGAADGSTGRTGGCRVANETDTTTATCNGDGNLIMPIGDSYGEPFLFWQHLANASLIRGNYTGSSVTSGGCGGLCGAVIETNIPKTSIDGVSFSVIAGSSLSSGDAFTHPRTKTGDNFFAIGRETSALTDASFLSTVDAHRVDTKFDDGNAVTGAITAHKQNNCTTTYSDATAIYNTTVDSEVRCSLYYQIR